MAATSDLYQVLQVNPAAEPEVIRAAYVCLAKKYHPDAGAIASDRMVALNAAWAVLGDRDGHAAYDRARLAVPVRQPAGQLYVDEPEWKAADVPPPNAKATDPASSTMDFGRYAGWTFSAIARQDSNYLEWLERAQIGRQYRVEIHALLSARESAAKMVTSGAPTGRPPGRRLRW
jgi:curved DNA-binding protein CbpA